MTATRRVAGRATPTRVTRTYILRRLDRLEKSERRTRHIAKESRYLVQILGHEVREMAGIFHDERFPSSPEAPPPFYKSKLDGGDEDIAPEAEGVEFVTPQERRASGANSGHQNSKAARKPVEQ